MWDFAVSSLVPATKVNGSTHTCSHTHSRKRGAGEGNRQMDQDKEETERQNREPSPENGRRALFCRNIHSGSSKLSVLEWHPCQRMMNLSLQQLTSIMLSSLELRGKAHLQRTGFSSLYSVIAHNSATPLPGVAGRSSDLHW